MFIQTYDDSKYSAVHVLILRPMGISMELQNESFIYSLHVKNRFYWIQDMHVKNLTKECDCSTLFFFLGRGGGGELEECGYLRVGLYSKTCVKQPLKKTKQRS